MVTEDEKELAEREYYRTHIEGKAPWKRYGWWAYRHPIRALGAKTAAGIIGGVAYRKLSRRAQNSPHIQQLKKTEQYKALSKLRRGRFRRTSRRSKRRRRSKR